MNERPIILCSEGYAILADEAANRAQAGYLALARLKISQDPAQREGYIAIVSRLVEWAIHFHSRLTLCPRTCERCSTLAALSIHDPTREAEEMFNKILLSVLNVLVPQLLDLLSPQIIKGTIDKALDAIENAVAESATQLDDATILPICQTIRAALNVPDNDE